MKRLLPPQRNRTTVDVSLAIVNLVLLMIFFFLTSGQLANRSAAEVELSETTELPLDRLPKPILVVQANGGWELDGRTVAPELLAVALQNLAQPVILHVLIGRDAPAQSLLDIVTRPDLANIDLRLVTLRRKVQP